MFLRHLISTIFAVAFVLMAIASTGAHSLAAVTIPNPSRLACPPATASLQTGLPPQFQAEQKTLAETTVTPIPEVDPAVPAIILCVATVVFAQVRKRRV